MKRTANIIWIGRLKSGGGEITTQSRVLNTTKCSYASRFGEKIGTNPEELLAAAHVTCFAMSLANELDTANLTDTKLEVQGSVRIDLNDSVWQIEEVDLFLSANLKGAPAIPFLIAATKAKSNCPMSRVFSTKISLHTELENQHSGSKLENEVVIYTSSYDQLHGDAKTLLETQGIRYREVDLDVDTTNIAGQLRDKTGIASVPQIFIGKHYVGSYQDLLQLDKDHGLKKLLQSKDEPEFDLTGLNSLQTQSDSMKVSV